VSDPRLTPDSGRVSLRGPQAQGGAVTDGTPARVGVPLADLCRTPDGPRDRQVLRGALVTLIDRQDAHSFIQVSADGYCGWVRSDTLTEARPMTHRVRALATHLYTRPDLKSPDRLALSLNTQLALGVRNGDLWQTDCGHWVPAAHVAPLDKPEADPIAVARQFLGVPYLWGGNSCWGIDCSGLVQAALHACGQTCAGDSDLQLAAFAPNALPDATQPERGDLMFWKGHVAWVSAPDRLLHATAFGMCVIEEPLAAARARIEALTPRLAHIRPKLS